MAAPILTPVDSSWVEALGHDPEAQELWLRTRGGRTYVYSGVPRYVYNLMRDANSTGKAFNRLALKKYPVRRA